MANYPPGFFVDSTVTPHELSSMTTALSGQGALTPAGVLQPAWLFGYTQVATANSTIVVNIINASATGVLTPVQHQIHHPQLVLDNVITFPTPIPFDKGIQWAVTATGGANASIWFHWASKPVKRGPGTGAT